MEQKFKTPARLWVGLPSQVVHEVELFLQKTFCKNNGCSLCTICMQIRQRQYHSCLWFNPPATYTLDVLKPFFTTISRSLMAHEQFYFIFQNADYLSHACTNSLLKSIEEPPHGYHTIFIAQRMQAIAPTLRSRCTPVYSEKNELQAEEHDLIPFFTQKKYDPELFIQMLEKSPLTEQSVTTLLNACVTYWCSEYDKTIENGGSADAFIGRIDCLKKASEKPPMPGSAKIFLKNLFLQCNY